jgi:hypothetical protein
VKRANAIFACALLCLLAPAVHAAPAANAAAALPAIARDYALILRARVHDGRVDYSGLRARDRAKLGGVLDRMAMIDDAALPPKQQLAFRIDLYNATVLAAVCDRYHAGYSVAEKDYALFHAPLVRRPGGRMTLDSLEKAYIRGIFRDPRVHAALCCAAVSCPPIAANAYLAMPVDSALDANIRRFVTDPARNTIDVRAKKLVLSHIFDWYADDFGGAAAVPAAIERWSGTPARGFAVSFRDYDWALNDAAAPPR